MTLVVVIIAVAVVAIVIIVAVVAVVQMRGLALGLHCADCIMCIVRIVSCASYGLHRTDCIVWIALCGLHCADCIVPSAVLYRLRCANKHYDVVKEEELIVRNCVVASSCMFCLATREYIVPKIDVFVRCLRNFFVELLEE